MTIRARIASMIGAFVAGLGLLAALAIWTSATVVVNGPVYAHIAQQKDLAADVHPPPAFAIEAYVAAHQLSEQTERAAGQALIARLAADFEASHARWARALPPGPLAEAAAEAHRTGAAFLGELEREVVPSFLAGQDGQGERALLHASDAFETHRAAVARLVALADQATVAAEAAAAEAVRLNTIRIVLLALAAAGVVAVLAFAVGRRLERSVRGLGAELTGLTQAIGRGDLRRRAEPEAVEAEFRPLVDGVNRTVEALVRPIDLTAEHVGRMGRGDLPPPIEAHLEGELATITASLDGCSAALRSLLDELQRMAEAHERGDTAATIDTSRFQGAYARVAAGVNAMVSSHLGDMRMALGAFDEFGRGNFAVSLPRLPGQKAAINDTVERVRASLDAFVTEMQRMAAGQEVGDVEAAIDTARFQGDWQAMANRVNGMAARNFELTSMLLACVDEFGCGRFDTPIENLPGKLYVITETVDRVRAHLKALVEDTDALATAAREGRLSVRADPERHEGDFRRIVAGLNATFDALDAPIQEATRVLSRMAARDITARMTEQFEGDHVRLAKAVNGTAESLASALGQVTVAVHQVSSAASEISSAAHSVAKGASAQAAEVERIRGRLDGIGELTRSAAGQADRAESLSRQANELASNGRTAVEGMNGAMVKIKSSAQRTSQIIKDINEIAFQTNLLALNAAVEAARAGDAGRGFAVVAEEVRSLAHRCKEAAQKTEALIQEAVQQAIGGEGTAQAVGSTLRQISGHVEEMTGMVTAIARSSRDQTEGIEAVGKAVGEVDRVMQQTAASAEEASSAAIELSGQAEVLGGMIGTFRLREEAAGVAGLTPAGPAWRAALRA